MDARSMVLGIRMHITVLDRDTELAETVLASPPRVLGRMAWLFALILAASFAWAYLTKVDKVVTSAARVRTAASPMKDFSAPSGQDVSAAISGQISSVLVREGDQVSAGQLIIELDARRIENEAARLVREVEAGTEEIAKREGLLAGVAAERDGTLDKSRLEIVEAEQALALEVQRDDVAEQRRKTEERALAIEVEKLADEASRLERLRQSRIVSQIEYNRVEFALKAARARLETSQVRATDAGIRLARSRLKTAVSSLSLLERQFTSRLEEARCEIARRKGAVEVLEKAMANLALERTQCQIRSPIDGSISMCRVQPGQMAQAGQPLATIVDGSGYRIDAAVSTADIGEIRSGMRARVKLDAFDYQRYGALDATVTHVAPDVDSRSQKPFYVVRMAIDHAGLGEGAKVKLGMDGRAEIIVSGDRLLWLILDGIKGSLSFD
jgi:HlyD family type I secretion membrane fusion protein